MIYIPLPFRVQISSHSYILDIYIPDIDIHSFVLLIFDDDYLLRALTFSVTDTFVIQYIHSITFYHCSVFDLFHLLFIPHWYHHIHCSFVIHSGDPEPPTYLYSVVVSFVTWYIPTVRYDYISRYSVCSVLSDDTLPSTIGIPHFICCATFIDDADDCSSRAIFLRVDRYGIRTVFISILLHSIILHSLLLIRYIHHYCYSIRYSTVLLLPTTFYSLLIHSVTGIRSTIVHSTTVRPRWPFCSDSHSDIRWPYILFLIHSWWYTGNFDTYGVHSGDTDTFCWYDFWWPWCSLLSFVHTYCSIHFLFWSDTILLYHWFDLIPVHSPVMTYGILFVDDPTDSTLILLIILTILPLFPVHSILMHICCSDFGVTVTLFGSICWWYSCLISFIRWYCLFLHTFHSTIHLSYSLLTPILFHSILH